MPGKSTPGGRIVPKTSQPKLCPRCLNICVDVSGAWVCPKHGPIVKP